MKFRCEQYPQAIVHLGDRFVQFVDGEAETTDRDEIDALKRTPGVDVVGTDEAKPKRRGRSGKTAAEKAAAAAKAEAEKAAADATAAELAAAEQAAAEQAEKDDAEKAAADAGGDAQE